MPTVIIKHFKRWQKLIHRALWALIIFNCSCQNISQPWQTETFNSSRRCKAIKRVYYSPEDLFCSLQMEILESKAQRQIFINIFSTGLTADNPQSSTIEIRITAAEDTRLYQAYLYKGGQRLLLPAESYDWIIDNLVSSTALKLEVGRYSAQLESANFFKALQK